MNHATHQATANGNLAADRVTGHVVPIGVLLAVWAALLALTFVTVAATWADLGKFNLWLALIIATVKASLVALYFMHLRYDRPFHALILIGSLVFVMLFVAVALLDTLEYQPELIPGYAPLIRP
jgi:cytochrome c oxidase subunit IV